MHILNWSSNRLVVSDFASWLRPWSLLLQVPLFLEHGRQAQVGNFVHLAIPIIHVPANIHQTFISAKSLSAAFFHFISLDLILRQH